GTDATLGDVLLRTHRSYAPALLPLVRDGSIHALAHITGGGIPGNLDRVLPDGVGAHIDARAWTPGPEFRVVAERGSVPDDEMYATFNMGVGMIAIVSSDRANDVLERLGNAGEQAFRIGETTPGTGVHIESSPW